MPAAKSFYDIIKAVPKGRWSGIQRNYNVFDVLKLRGSLDIEYTIAAAGANRLWQLLQTEPFVPALGALTGNQAMQMVRAGLQAIYLSGWQAAADNNTAGTMYPDQGLYPSNTGPELCNRINKALQLADQIEVSELRAAEQKSTSGKAEALMKRNWFAPIVADADAGFGGPLNCYELMKMYIEAGVAGVHFEDQLAAEKKCGHLGGKVLIPTATHLRALNAARLAADVLAVPTVLISRTDAESATLLTSDIDERDQPFVDYFSGRTSEGFYRLKQGSGMEHCIQRSLAFAPYSDLLWWETSSPNLEHAKTFAEAIRKVYPDKMMAYNCSPSFNWLANLSPESIACFQRELGAMGYKFQFVTLAGFHTLNHSMYELAQDYRQRGMEAYSDLQQREFASQSKGYTAVRHQREVGTGYYDLISMTATGGWSSTTALGGSTEKAQFRTGPPGAPVRHHPVVQQPMEHEYISRASRAGYATQAGQAGSSSVSEDH